MELQKYMRGGLDVSEAEVDSLWTPYADAQRALDAERERARVATQLIIETIGSSGGPEDLEEALGRMTAKLATLQARCAHLDVLLRDEYLPKLDVVAVQRSIADRDSRIDALEREVEKLDDDKETLQAQVKQLDRTLADVYQQRDGLQAQLRQVEGERDEWERKCRGLCQAHGVLLIEHHDVKKDLTTLRQLVAALPVVDVQEVSVWLSPDESGWLVSKRPAFPAGLYWAKFRTQAEADSFRSLLAYRATLAAQREAAQDAGKEDVSHD